VIFSAAPADLSDLFMPAADAFVNVPLTPAMLAMDMPVNAPELRLGPTDFGSFLELVASLADGEEVAVYSTSFPGEMCPSAPNSTPESLKLFGAPQTDTALPRDPERAADSDVPNVIVDPMAVLVPATFPPPAPALSRPVADGGSRVCLPQRWTPDTARTVRDVPASGPPRTSLGPHVRQLTTAFAAQISEREQVPPQLSQRIADRELPQTQRVDGVSEVAPAPEDSTSLHVVPKPAVSLRSAPAAVSIDPADPAEAGPEPEIVRLQAVPRKSAGEPSLPSVEVPEARVEGHAPADQNNPQEQGHPDDSWGRSQVQLREARDAGTAPTGHADTPPAVTHERKPAEPLPQRVLDSVPVRQAAELRMTTTNEVPAQARLVREVVIQIGGSAGERVEVQVIERAGAVRVNVRTADRDLTSALRANLGELVRSITEKGLAIETWTPAETWPATSPAPTAEVTGSTSESAHAAGTGGHGAGQQHAPGDAGGNHGDVRDGERRGRARALWLEEMERRLEQIVPRSDEK
jgi:hypothetical protein